MSIDNIRMLRDLIDRIEKPARMLMVEDSVELSTAIRDMSLSIVEKLTIDICDTSVKAIDKISESVIDGNQYDILWLDLVIPGDRGGSVVAQYCYANSPDTAIIVCTGYFNPEQVSTVLGDVPYVIALRKPITINDLRRVLRIALKPYDLCVDCPMRMRE